MRDKESDIQKYIYIWIWYAAMFWFDFHAERSVATQLPNVRIFVVNGVPVIIFKILYIW